MKRAKALIAVFLAITWFSGLNAFAAGKVNVQVKFEEKLTFSEESNLKKASFFCATEDGLIIIPDKGSKCVKIFDNDGKKLDLSATIGVKDGKGPFEELTSCFYRESESQLAFFDAKKSKVFLYDRIGRLGFQPYKEVLCLRRARDLNVFESQLIISAYKTDSNKTPYDLYSKGIDSNKTTYLLQSWFKYGLENMAQYIAKYRKKPDLRARGINGWFDVDTNGNIYFVWEGDINTLQKINIKSGERTALVSPNINNDEKRSVGENRFEYYVKADQYINDLLKAHENRDIARVLNIRAKMSYVRDIFVVNKVIQKEDGQNKDFAYIFLIYEGTAKKSQSQFRFQVYTLNGKFIADAPIPGKPSKNMYLDKKNDILYSLSDQGSGKQKYSILKYKIFVK